MRRFLLKLSKRRGLWTVAIIFAVLFVAAPQISNASWWDVLSPEKLVSQMVFAITYFLSIIAGVIIAIQSWFLQIILQVGMNLVNSSPVRVGFPIVLSIANLFFVGALIVIAIATILRREEYGAKNVLWKLVVMAVMVNFGLVICGTLLSISDETAKFFVESVSPGSSGPDGETNFTGFAESIAGAFNPQAVILSQKDITENPAVAQEAISGAASAGDTFAGILRPLISLLSTLGSLVITIITITTLNAMLLWRYIRLGMALIVLPLAWAAWIFPTYQQHYKKWWTKFTQWAIFPPVVIFFIWLGLKVSEVMSQKGGEFAAIYQDAGENPVAAFFGGLFTPIISQTLNSFILFGLMMGGLIAAQELGVKFAEGGYKAVEGAGKGAKNWAMRKTNRATARPREAMSRGATRIGAGAMTGLEKMRLPFLNKKRTINDQGKVERVEKAPEEKLSGILKAKADNSRDAMEERLEPGGSLKQRKGETLEQWQERLGKKSSKFGSGESDAEWEKRFKEGAAKAVEDSPGLEKGDNEDDASWKARILAARPELNRREGASESPEEWKKKVNGAIEELVKRAEGSKGHEEDNKGLLASVWGGATAGFTGKGHKQLNQKELNELLEKMGVHVPHEKHDEGAHDAHPPAPAGGGGAGHGPAPAAH